MIQKTPMGFIKNDVFKKLRKEKGISKSSLSHFLDIDIGTICRLETTIHKPINVSFFIIGKYATFFNIPTDEFYDKSVIKLNK